VPYFESDHVLNIAYNVITGGTCLEDIDRLRDDENYTRSLAAERVRRPAAAASSSAPPRRRRSWAKRWDSRSVIPLWRRQAIQSGSTWRGDPHAR